MPESGFRLIAEPGKPSFMITQSFAAPRELVYEALLRPEFLTRWWSQGSYTLVSCEADPKPGGVWRLALRFGDGPEQAFHGVYREISRPERLVYTFVYDPMPQSPATVTLSLEEHGGLTRMTEVTQHSSVQARDGHIDSGLERGARESLQRLSKLLDTITMNSEPLEQHKWLQKFVGEWTFETEVLFASDKPPQKFKGTESVRAFGDLWIIAEGQGEAPCGGTAKTLFTMGYDPQKNQYVGSWIGSTMTHMWVYAGQKDESQKALAFEVEGPSMVPDEAFSGKKAMYRDSFEFIDDNHRVLRSHILGKDGQWHPMMTCHYSRTK